jgi:hypothetical protein
MSGSCPVGISVRTHSIFTEISYGFPQSLQAVSQVSHFLPYLLQFTFTNHTTKVIVTIIMIQTKVPIVTNFWALGNVHSWHTRLKMSRCKASTWKLVWNASALACSYRSVNEHTNKQVRAVLTVIQVRAVLTSIHVGRGLLTAIQDFLPDLQTTTTLKRTSCEAYINITRVHVKFKKAT